MIAAHPALLCYSVPDRLQPFFSYLTGELGLSAGEAAGVVERRPTLVGVEVAGLRRMVRARVRACRLRGAGALGSSCACAGKGALIRLSDHPLYPAPAAGGLPPRERHQPGGAPGAALHHALRRARQGQGAARQPRRGPRVRTFEARRFLCPCQSSCNQMTISVDLFHLFHM